MKDPLLRSVGAPFVPATIAIAEGELSIGRAEESTISLPSKAVSRAHARLRRKGDKLTIEDLGSRNGTRRNGAVVEGVCELEIGDRLRFGEYEFVVERPPGESEAATIFDGGDDLAATLLAPPTAPASPPAPRASSPPSAAAPPAPSPPPATKVPPAPEAPATVIVPPAGKREPSVSLRTVTPPTMIATDPPAAPAAVRSPSKPTSPPPVAKAAASSRSAGKSASPGPSLLGLSMIAITTYVVVVAAGYAWWMFVP